MNRIQVFSTRKKFDKEVKKISAISRKIFLMLKKKGFSADIYMVDDGMMRKLNRQFRKKDKPTNVLSFCEPKNFVREPNRYKHLGEIYIGLDFVKKHGQSAVQMTVHGILHLFGYDHIRSKDRKFMEKKENSILKILG